jgi:hypothetical protein
MNMLSMAVTELVWILVGKQTVLVELYVGSKESRRFFFILYTLVYIYISTDDLCVISNN